MKPATYWRALDAAHRGLRGPKQRRALRIQRARFRASLSGTGRRRTKRAYFAAARQGRALFPLIVSAVGVLGVLACSCSRRTAP